MFYRIIPGSPFGVKDIPPLRLGAEMKTADADELRNKATNEEIRRDSEFWGQQEIKAVAPSRGGMCGDTRRENRSSAPTDEETNK